MEKQCDVCGKVKETEYCRVCKANICHSCKKSPRRLSAFLKRKGISVREYLAKARH